MPIPWPLAIAVYFTLWWLVLFAVLPIDIRSLHEVEGAPEAEGSDPGAPVAPRLLFKAAITTVVTTVIFAIFLAFVAYS